MKFTFVKSLPLLAALALCGCEATVSKKPVGERGAELKPDDWNGRWVGGDGTILETKIKDAKLGLVELTPVKPKAKPGEPKEIDLVVRTLGTHTIVNLKQKPTDEAYDFGRVSVDNTHLVGFAPNTPMFIELIKEGKLTGRIEKDKDGKLTGSCTLESFTEQDYQRLKRDGVDVRALFGEDPVTVAVRVK